MAYEVNSFLEYSRLISDLWSSSLSLDSLPNGGNGQPTCDESAAPLVLNEGRENTVAYTYSVNWIESTVCLLNTDI